MASWYLYSFATTIVLWLGWTLVSLLINYNVARRMGYPIVVSPVHPLNIVWILMRKGFLDDPTGPNLPSWLGKWTRCAHMSWMFQDNSALHEELGKIFVLVTPSVNQVIVADPEATYSIMQRRKEFVKPIAMYKPLGLFGRNIDIVEGDDWQRHRRMTAPSFNEKVSSLVWDEAQRQADGMLQLWLKKGSAGTRETQRDTAKLALHVLISAGFGISYRFQGGVQELVAGHSMSFVDALERVLRNIIGISLIPRKILASSMMPRSLKDLFHATQEFQQYMKEMVENERNQISKYGAGESNLMTVLVQASEDARQSCKPASAFADDEVFGNVFFYVLAGHESTANTIAYALILLAANPERQEWIGDEIKYILDKYSTTENQKYVEIYPRLKRCQALLYETIRLFGPVIFVPKTTGLQHPNLIKDGKDCMIPPETDIVINIRSLNTDPSLWGSDSLKWRPERWLISPSSSSAKFEEESLVEQQPGVFVPWADGPRNCPGKKFAQVEFVAVMAILFQKHRVRPVLVAGETFENGRKRLMQMADNSALTAITLQMRDPKRVSLRWSPKGEE